MSPEVQLVMYELEWNHPIIVDGWTLVTQQLVPDDDNDDGVREKQYNGI